MLSDFQIAAVMLSVPFLAFFCNFFIFIQVIAFFAFIIIILVFDDLFYHFYQDISFLTDFYF